MTTHHTGEHGENCTCVDCSKTYPPTSNICGRCGKPIDNHKMGGALALPVCPEYHNGQWIRP